MTSSLALADLKRLHPTLTTGDKLPARSPPDPAAKAARPRFAPLPPVTVERWAGPLRVAFELFAPQALYIASPAQPVSVAWLSPGIDGVRIEGWKGGNPFRWRKACEEADREDWVEPKGAWPVKIGLTHQQDDRITARLPRDPLMPPWAVRRRVWCRGLAESDDAIHLEQAVRAMLERAREAAHAEPLPYGCIDAGHRFSPVSFEQDYVIPAARELGLWARSELGLEQFLRRAMERCIALYGERSERGRREFPALCALLIEEEAEARAKRRALDRPGMTALGEPITQQHRRVATHPIGFPVKVPDYGPELARQIEARLREKSLAAEDGVVL